MEIGKEHLAYIELMSRNMNEHLTEAIHDYISIHKLDHEEVGAIVIPFVVAKVHTTDDGECKASAHTLVIANTNGDNVVNILKGVVDKIEGGAQPIFRGPVAMTDG